MTITFCGHGNIYYDNQIKEALYKETEKLIAARAKRFLLGGYGNFDILAAETVKQLKQKYGYIESILVIPYLNRNYSVDLYDYTLYPPIENTPMRFAISKRNEWMVKNSDVLIAYIENSFGGAVKMLNIAKKNNKTIIQLNR